MANGQVETAGVAHILVVDEQTDVRMWHALRIAQACAETWVPSRKIADDVADRGTGGFKPRAVRQFTEHSREYDGY